MFRPEGVPSSPIVVLSKYQVIRNLFLPSIKEFFFPPSQPWNTVVFASVSTLLGALVQFYCIKMIPNLNMSVLSCFKDFLKGFSEYVHPEDKRVKDIILPLLWNLRGSNGGFDNQK